MQGNEVGFVALRVFKNSLHQRTCIQGDGLSLVLDFVCVLDLTDFDGAKLPAFKISIVKLENKRELIGGVIRNMLL